MHDIVLQQGGRVFTQVGFNLDMTVAISPDSGPPGTPIRVDVRYRVSVALQFLGCHLRQ
jgi:hypothetical protein